MKEFLEACQAIVDYMWDDEEKDWEACGKPNNHIFTSLKLVNNFLEKPLGGWLIKPHHPSKV